MADIRQISLKNLRPNPLNEKRSMDYKEIENLRDSISEAGLLHPLTVYENGDGTYTLISGHRRFAAISSMEEPFETVPCTVIDKPEDKTAEAECMARANVHRSSPEEIRTEIRIANDLWNSLPPERKKYWSKKFEATFVENNKDNPAYQDNPKAFKTNRFRPRLEYINHITGLNMSNRSLSAYLRTTLNDEGEALGAERKRKTSYRTSTKRILSTLTKLNDQLNNYAYKADRGKPEDIAEFQTQLGKMIEMFQNATDKDF